MNQVPLLAGGLGAMGDPMDSAAAVARNYNARYVSPRGGILPIWATQTGDVPLPQGIRYDPLGYAWAAPAQPRFAVAGMGDANETPEIRPLPWGPDTQELARQKKQERLDYANLMVGLVGGTLGILLSAQAVRSMLKKKKR